MKQNYCGKKMTSNIAILLYKVTSESSGVLQIPPRAPPTLSATMNWAWKAHLPQNLLLLRIKKNQRLFEKLRYHCWWNISAVQPPAIGKKNTQFNNNNTCEVCIRPVSDITPSGTTVPLPFVRQPSSPAASKLGCVCDVFTPHGTRHKPRSSCSVKWQMFQFLLLCLKVSLRFSM